MSDEAYPRVLYVGNLGTEITEDLLLTLFAAFGVCKSCKIIHEAGTDLYAFLEFTEHREAQMALMAMNKRQVLGRELKVNWATSPGATAKPDTSNHFHVFVGDLSPDIESAQLKEAFSPFGEISDCKVIRDSQTHRSKGYAFICFVNKEDAEMAIAGMNGQWLGGRNIRTNWASGKGNTITRSARDMKALNYDEVYKQTSETNTTVYCGGIQNGLTDEMMKETFGEYGTVKDVRCFKEKGFAFVKMDTKDAACNAICSVHGTEVGGFIVKCSWGKENPEGSNTGGMQPGVMPMGPYMGYNPYMQGYGYPGYYGGYWGGYGPQAGGPMGPYPPQGYVPPQGQWGGYGDYYNYGGGPGNIPPNNAQGNMNPQGGPPGPQGGPGPMGGPPGPQGPPGGPPGPQGGPQGGPPHPNAVGDMGGNNMMYNQQWGGPNGPQQQWGGVNGPQNQQWGGPNNGPPQQQWGGPNSGPSQQQWGGQNNGPQQQQWS